jgi:hypothetical protein
MNTCMSNTSHGRLAELNPFDIRLTVETKAAPCKRTIAAGEKLADDIENEAESGCVDWYCYPDQEGETGVEK